MRCLKAISKPYKGKGGYLYVRVRHCDGAYTPVRLHRYKMRNELGVLGAKYPDKEFVVHHIDGDRLNNDISNLEVMEQPLHMKLHGKNITPKRVKLNNYSAKSKGYALLKNKNPEKRCWRASIEYNKKKTFLGLFEDPISANLVYELTKKEIVGWLNK